MDRRAFLTTAMLAAVAPVTGCASGGGPATGDPATDGTTGTPTTDTGPTSTLTGAGEGTPTTADSGTTTADDGASTTSDGGPSTTPDAHTTAAVADDTTTGVTETTIVGEQATPARVAAEFYTALLDRNFDAANALVHPEHPDSASFPITDENIGPTDGITLLGTEVVETAEGTTAVEVRLERPDGEAGSETIGLRRHEGAWRVWRNDGCTNVTC